MPWAFSAVAGCFFGGCGGCDRGLGWSIRRFACGMAVVKGNENWSVATNRGLRSKYGVFSAVTDLLTEAAQQTPVFVRQRGRVRGVRGGAFLFGGNWVLFFLDRQIDLSARAVIGERGGEGYGKSEE